MVWEGRKEGNRDKSEIDREKRKMEKERQEVRGRKERIQKYRRTFGSSFLIISISFKYLRYALEREVYSYRHVLYPPRN